MIGSEDPPTIVLNGFVMEAGEPQHYVLLRLRSEMPIAGSAVSIHRVPLNDEYANTVRLSDQVENAKLQKVTAVLRVDEAVPQYLIGGPCSGPLVCINVPPGVHSAHTQLQIHLPHPLLLTPHTRHQLTVPNALCINVSFALVSEVLVRQ
jgi:hypothetical protein